MDILTMAQLNKLKKSGGAGWEETKRIHIPTGNTPCPFTSAKQVIGMKATCEVNDRRMKFEPERPQTEVAQVFGNFIVYGQGRYSGNPIFDKPCLMVQMGGLSGELKKCALSVCPGFFDFYADYNALVYIYETTSDLLGLGMTAEKGWYAANLSTFAFVPFNIEEMPLFFFEDYIMKYMVESGATIDDYFYEIAPIVKNHSFTITERNIGNEIYILFSSADFTNANRWETDHGLTSSEVVGLYLRYMAILFNFEEGTMGGVNATLQYETIHPIDPKFIPGAVLPVVELETVLDADAQLTEFTEQENTAITAAAQGNKPFIVSANITKSGMTVATCSVANYNTYNGMVYYSFRIEFPDSTARACMILSVTPGVWGGVLTPEA